MQEDEKEVAETEESEGKAPARRKLSWRVLLSWLHVIPWRSVGKWVCRAFRKKWVQAVSAMMAFVMLGWFAALILSGAMCNQTEDRILSIEELTEAGIHADCILVLGCKVMDDGTPSARLYDRVKAGSEVWLAGLGDRILMSGDSSREDYDEVGTMKRTAAELGVSVEVIDTDGMGLSTYDSIARIAEEYRGKRLIIVTQEYHLYRALYIAEKFGLEAWGVSADAREYEKQAWHSFREVLARCKAVYFAEKKPAPAGT